jgi:hypothetical protein
MSANARKYSTISFNAIHAADLQEVCRSLDMNKVEFVEKAIQFFKQTGIDPRHKTDFRSETNRIIGFLRVQDDNAQAHFHKLETQIKSIQQSEQADMLDAMIQLMKNQTRTGEIMESILRSLQAIEKKR